MAAEELAMLRDAARDWTQERSPTTALRRLRDAGEPLGYDRALWREMAELGWPGVLAPEAHGGSALGCTAMGLVLAETGRTLTASPLLASGLIGVSALVLGGSEAQQAEHLPGLAAGETTAALAVDEGPHHTPDQVSLLTEAGEHGWRLTGDKLFVVDGLEADLLVVPARVGGLIGLFLVRGDDPGVSRRPRRLADSRGYADIRFERAAAEPLGEEPRGGQALLEAILDRGRVGLAAEMLGSAAQAFEITLAYLKTRTQFGQLIGGFQALQHRAAQMFTELELARSCVEAALDAIDRGSPDVPALASLAKARANDSFHRVSNEMVQMHGGIGMTDEHDAGLYLKRARVAEALFGSSAFHRDRYASLMGF